MICLRGKPILMYILHWILSLHDNALYFF